jgi:hypothetical protein
LRDKDEVSVLEILADVFRLEPAKQDKVTQMRVSTILVKIGWQKAGRTLHQGKRQVLWKPAKKTAKYLSPEKGVAGNERGVSAEKNGSGFATPFSADLQKDNVTRQYFTHTTKATDQNSPDQEEEAKPDPCDQEIRAGDWVELVHIDGHEGDHYRVKNCGPTHVEIEGCSDHRAVPVWAVKKVEGKVES